MSAQTSVPALGHCWSSAVTTEVKDFNSLVVESLCVLEAWPALQEQMGQRRDLLSRSAGCKDDVSSLDNLPLWTSQMTQECRPSGLLNFSVGSKGS